MLLLQCDDAIMMSLFLQFFKLGLVEKFHSSLIHGPRPRYHASRALVYLGKLEMLKGISLFEPIATGRNTIVTSVATV